MTESALPSNVGVGTVIGTFVTSQKGESGSPVTTPIAGTVTFQPTPSYLIDAAVTPKLIILPKPVTVTLDANGSFSVSLVATDDTDLNPTGWNYRVTFQLIGASFGAFNINVPEGATVDLAIASPVASSNGVLITRGQGIPDTSTATVGQVPTFDGTDIVWADPPSASTSIAWTDITGKPTSFTPSDASVTNAKVASNAAISSDKLADGTTNKVYTATEKTKLAGIASGATANVSWFEVITANGNVTVPAGISLIEIECLGGGGGGGGGGTVGDSGSDLSFGGGGGAAGVNIRRRVAVTAGDVLACVVGAGGPGGAGAAAFTGSTVKLGVVGTKGGDTSVSRSGDILCYAPGGQAGFGGINVSGSPAPAQLTQYGYSDGPVYGTAYVPGSGGASYSNQGAGSDGTSATAAGLGQVGGSGGGDSQNPLGGSGGMVANGRSGAYSYILNWFSVPPASEDANGVAGASATANSGNGGAGGGGGAPGGSGGQAGSGGSGLIIIRALA